MSAQSVNAYNAFLAVLAIAALVASIALLVPGFRLRVSRTFGPAELLGAATLVAIVCTAGSLTYSEVIGYQPCFLCWVQRGFMYPLVVVAGAAAAVARSTRHLWTWVAPMAMALTGLAVSVWHYLEQTIPGLSIGACEVGVPCGAKYVNQFGFISIPFMAGCGFLAIAALAFTARSASEMTDERTAVTPAS